MSEYSGSSPQSSLASSPLSPEEGKKSTRKKVWAWMLAPNQTPNILLTPTLILLTLITFGTGAKLWDLMNDMNRQNCLALAEARGDNRGNFNDLYDTLEDSIESPEGTKTVRELRSRMNDRTPPRSSEDC